MQYLYKPEHSAESCASNSPARSRSYHKRDGRIIAKPGRASDQPPRFGPHQTSKAVAPSSDFEGFGSFSS